MVDVFTSCTLLLPKLLVPTKTFDCTKFGSPSDLAFAKALAAQIFKIINNIAEHFFATVTSLIPPIIERFSIF